ncbi:hypothetical protein ACWDYH_39325 [Nocardia goodfellowii]
MKFDGKGQPPRLTNAAARSAPRKLSDKDAVAWLALNHNALEEIKYLADQIGEVADVALETLSPGRQVKRLADHFWCDVVGALAWVLAEIQGAVDKLRDCAIDWLVDAVWRQMRESRTTDCGNTPNGRTSRRSCRADDDAAASVSEQLLKDLVKSVLKKVCGGLTLQVLSIDAIVLKLRILAIVICPDVLAHKLVWDHCFVPLFQQWTDDLTP